MEKVNRYSISGEGFTYIRPDSSGVWVKYEDVKKYLPKEDATKKQYMKCPDCGNDTFIYDIHCGSCGRVQWA